MALHTNLDECWINFRWKLDQSEMLHSLGCNKLVNTTLTTKKQMYKIMTSLQWLQGQQWLQKWLFCSHCGQLQSL